MFFNNFDYYKYKDKVDFCSIEQNVEGLLFGRKFRAESSCENASTYVLLHKVVNICILASILPNPNEPKQ